MGKEIRSSEGQQSESENGSQLSPKERVIHVETSKTKT
jgi:hypothetical protein